MLFFEFDISIFQFIFDPSQFLTTTGIKSYFSRLACAQRLHGSQSQSSINNNSTDHD